MPYCIVVLHKVGNIFVVAATASLGIRGAIMTDFTHKPQPTTTHNRLIEPYGLLRALHTGFNQQTRLAREDFDEGTKNLSYSSSHPLILVSRHPIRS